MNTIFKLAHFERFMCDLIYHVNDVLGKGSNDEFVRKAIMYISFIENFEAKAKILQELKGRLADFESMLVTYNVSLV